MNNFLNIKKIITLLSLSYLIMTSVNGTTVNCSGGECNFNNSIHYHYAKTYCMENLNFEKVETDFQYFTISKTGKRCDVHDSVDSK
jgi:hypothetical protein